MFPNAKYMKDSIERPMKKDNGSHNHGTLRRYTTITNFDRKL